jgi:hypothetical protein
MPELPINDFDPYGLNPLRTLSVMLFPDDIQRRNEFLNVLGIDIDLKVNKEFQRQGPELKKLLHAPSIDDIEKEVAQEIFPRAYQAGLMVLFLYVLKQVGKPPSVRRAVRLVESRYSKKLVQNGMKPIKHSETNIRKNWDYFKSVSHLWAAHMAFKKDEPIKSMNDYDMSNDFDLFLANSEFLLSFCLEIISDRVKTPLFNENQMWHLPKKYTLLDIAPIKILKISEKLREEIENYKV